MVRRVRARWSSGSSAARLESGEGDYEVDEKKRTVGVLESGIAKVEDYLGIDNLYESVNTPLIGYLNNAIKAKELFKRDKDYVNINGEILIVDEHTGRMLAGRRYNEGMHQAIEAKEGVEIQNENQTLATITLQNYFRMYDTLSGMTGTAQTEAAELNSIYKLGVVGIPTNRPMIRADQSDLVYRTEEAKFNAVVDDIAERHAAGQPVLVGTVSVEKSEYLSDQLRRRGVPHEVLNAKQHEREAAIVAQAGRKGAVTVATNMAGRGTDIMLGGNPEFTAVASLKQQGLDPEETPEEYEAAWDAALEAAEKAVASRARRGHRARWALRPRHRAARVPPHRQPAAWPLRPPGRPRREPVLPLAAGRPDAPVQRGDGRPVHDHGQDGGRGPDRVQDGLALHPERADPGRGPQLRDPQERPEVRRRAQPPARGHLRRAAPRARGRGPARADPPLHQRRRRAATSRPPRPAASPRTGTSTSCGRR